MAATDAAGELAVEAIVFDVFGTVVDWRSGIIREGEALGAATGLDVEWAAVADAWREEYLPQLSRVISGEIAWRNLDALHRESLEALLERFDVDAVTDAELDELTRAWHRLDPWPDAIPGLLRLKPHYVIAPLSNGHVRLLTTMAKRAGLPWDVILSAELSGTYKPETAAYLTAVDLLDCEPAEVLMVAAHEMDLAAAGEAGLRTAYVHRPDEWGAAAEAERPDASAFDVAADDIEDLADRLGAAPIA